ncbi:carboxypeptidase regulatory-like domain-containing protein [Candidatus Kaiserbacteria bacterium]|nr:carboxypeptidase regulatory-like domain-containing protein [Candidatus Kaiserbacteria bacterium]
MIDVIIGVALMLVLFLSLFGVLRASLILSTLAKAKASAVELASTQIEYLRGLSYDSLGTVGGIPSGAIEQNATTTIDGIQYVVRTFIVYHDDPSDGSGDQDTNGITIDYKTAKVAVSYYINGLPKEINLISNFVPPGIESSTGGGTLSIHVVNAANADVADANVHIVNTATSPAVDFTTFTNTSGFAIIGGAATSSEYQVYVSRTGYSSAQTYARTGTNVNPTPGYLTVSKDQVTSGTFFIDLLSTLIISSLSPAVTTSFSDLFADASNLANQTGTWVSGGALTLISGGLSGIARSISVTPSYLSGWGILSATLTTPPGTTAVVHVGDAGGATIPDSVLSGNASGFSSFPVSLTGIPSASYSTLTLSAELTSNSTTTAPEIFEWSISHTDGPTPLPNVAYTLTGAKTVGTNASGAPLYKTIVSGNTGASAERTEALEWDSYLLGLVNANLIEGCSASPYSLAPASTKNVAILVGDMTANTLPLVVENSASSTIASAKVVLAKSGYAATIPTNACGFAYFNGLASGSYSATVSASGYATTTFPNINVAGHSATTTLTLP